METFSALLAICAGNSSLKGLWRGALVFSLICTQINGLVNNDEAGDLRRYRAHYYVTVMKGDLFCFMQYEYVIRYILTSANYLMECSKT